MKIKVTSVDWKFYENNPGERHLWVTGDAELPGPGPVLSVRWSAAYGQTWELSVTGASLAPDTTHTILGEMKKILAHSGDPVVTTKRRSPGAGDTARFYTPPRECPRLCGWSGYAVWAHLERCTRALSRRGKGRSHAR